jgi:hypothetical protein
MNNDNSSRQMMSDQGNDNNYGSITDPILPHSPDKSMQDTELSEVGEKSEITEPLQTDDVGLEKLPEEMELNKVYETIGN